MELGDGPTLYASDAAHLGPALMMVDAPRTHLIQPETVQARAVAPFVTPIELRLRHLEEQLAYLEADTWACVRRSWWKRLWQTTAVQLRRLAFWRRR